MPTESFFASPPSAAGHTSFRMQAGAAAPNISSPPTWGPLFAITLGEFASFLRFELSVPAGSQIDSVKLNLISAPRLGGAEDAMVGFEAGFLAPDSRWETGTGFDGYPTRDSLPLPERGEGEDRDLSVYHGGGPAFSGITWPLHEPAATAGIPMSFGDASTSPILAVTGLSEQLQGYLETHEGLRGSVISNAIPVGLVLLDHYTGSSTPQGHQRAQNPETDPTYEGASLEVTYSQIQPRAASGRIRVNPGATGRMEIPQ